MPDGADLEFSLTFSELLTLLHKLELGTETSIASRFRKLRPKFASDQMLSRPGERVRYDLSRVLSICAVFMVNSVSIPQADAVSMVVPNWPEIARGFLAAHRTLSRESAAAPTTVGLYVDAFPLESSVGGSWAMVAHPASPSIPFIALDCADIVAVLHAMRPADPGLTTAFEDLDRTFGWDELARNDPTRLPSRPESGFFGTGPYFDRARALLSATEASVLRSRERIRLQAYLDYLESPAPIDAWKQFIGSCEEEEGLGFLLSAWAFGLGLKSDLVATHTLAAGAYPANERALDLVKRGEKRLLQIVKEARS